MIYSPFRLALVLLLFALTSCRQLASSSNSIDQSSAVKTMKLTSTALTQNQQIPVKHTCRGQNRSPALSWNAPPADTKSLVLVMTDLDAPQQPFVHWLIYDLPPDLRQLPEGLPNQPFLNHGGLQGKNSFGRYGYGGPCSPSGTHRYIFKLYALKQSIDLPPGASPQAAIAAMQAHILAEAELLGKYSQ